MSNEMQTKLFHAFSEKFGGALSPGFYFSPGRVNLIGEHTDYNGGHVFPCALTLGTYAAARRRSDRVMHFYSLNFPDAGVMEISLDDLVNRDANGWANYPLGIVWAFAERGYSFETGFDMVCLGNIPNGSGLSSSASLEVLTGLILTDLYGITDLTMVDLALIGQRAENAFNGCSCGIMDQFAVAMGKTSHAIFLDTATLEYSYAPLKLDGMKIVITNSNVKHSLVDSAYNDRRRESAEAVSDLQTVTELNLLGDLTPEEYEKYKGAVRDDLHRKRAHHAVYENQRTIDAAAALEKNDLEAFGRLMNESHDSLRDDYEVSCPEIDLLVELARKVPGVLGSRITGGGFGGCTVSIVKEESTEVFTKTVGEEYQKQTGLAADFYIVEAGSGAVKLA